MDKKNITKTILAESLRTLMVKMPFHSITIKKICDEAGVVRVTFYNYFVDKYDALSEIVHQDLKPGLDLVQQDAFKNLLVHLASVLMNNRRFYEIAVDIDGQNGFQEIFITQMKESLIQILNAHRSDTADLSNAMLADTYAVLIFCVVRTWLKKKNSLERELVELIEKLCTKSLYDLMNEA